MAHWKQLPEFQTYNQLSYTKGSIRVGKDRKLCMTTFMRPDADPFSVRIKVTGWAYGNGDLADQPLPEHDDAEKIDFGTLPASKDASR
jgi:hypothetical protein